MPLFIKYLALIILLNTEIYKKTIRFINFLKKNSSAILSISLYNLHNYEKGINY